MDNPYCSCKLTMVLHIDSVPAEGAKADQGESWPYSCSPYG